MKTMAAFFLFALSIGATYDAASCYRTMSKKMESGVWGGQHIGVEVTAAGATVEHDCAHGTIDQPIELDSKGDFDIRGTHVREHGGPTREGERETRQPARYIGHVDGKTMTLIVKLVDTDETIGTFTLAYEKTPILRKCG
jgi:hypothetical protein